MTAVEHDSRAERGAVWAWAVAGITLAFAAAPFLTEPFSGYTDDQLPIPQPDPVIQPPGWAFGIWGIIYLWLVLGSLYGLFRARKSDAWRAMRPPLFIALLIGTAWLSIATASAIWGTITLFMMAAAAIHALLRTTSDDWAWQTGPVGLFAGWLTAALGVSLAVTLSGFGVMDPSPAALLALSAVIVVAVTVSAARPGAWTYALGAGWALFGVCVTGVEQGSIITLALAALGLVAVAATVLRDLRKPTEQGRP